MASLGFIGSLETVKLCNLQSLFSFSGLEDIRTLRMLSFIVHGIVSYILSMCAVFVSVCAHCCLQAEEVTAPSPQTVKTRLKRAWDIFKLEYNSHCFYNAKPMNAKKFNLHHEINYSHNNTKTI